MSGNIMLTLELEKLVVFLIILTNQKENPIQI